MTGALGLGPIARASTGAGTGTGVTPTTPAAPTAELLTEPPALSTAAVFTATVVGQTLEGAVEMRSAYGTFSLKTTASLPTGARVELRFQPGNPPSITVLGVDDAAAADPPPWRLDLGTTTAATVVTPAQDAPDVAAGTRLLVRIIAPDIADDPATLAGQIIANLGGETLVETAIGTLALDLPLALPPGTALAFTRLGGLTSSPAASPLPSEAGSWLSLDQILTVLDKAAPTLALQFRAAIQPGSPAELAGTLLFLMGALYRGAWPDAAVDRALGTAGEKRLAQRLRNELADLTRLRDDDATGAWRVSVLPLLVGAEVQPLRLYLRRRGGTEPAGEDGARFVIEAELSRLGALQFDGMVRGAQLDVVLRSHGPFPAAMKQEVAAIFRSASAAHGLHGDIVFATTAQFDVRPLAGRQRHVEMQA